VNSSSGPAGNVLTMSYDPIASVAALPLSGGKCSASPVNCTRQVNCGGNGLQQRESFGVTTWKADLKALCTASSACPAADTKLCDTVTHRPYVYVAWGANFGDEIAVPLMRFAAGGSLPNCTYPKVGKGTLLGLGSTIHHMCMSKHKGPVVVWGSGGMHYTGDRCRNAPVDFDVRAVRGYKTLDMLVSINKLSAEKAKNVVLGDPALLLPQMFPQCTKSCKPAVDVCVVLHKNDMYLESQIKKELKQLPLKNFRVLSVKTNPTHMLEDLLGCSLVLSSSLHGIIFAEAFEVPARWLVLAGSAKSESRFKYEDYFTGTRGREADMELLGPVTTVKEGWEKGGAPPAVGYDPLPLLKAFPRKEALGECSGSGL